MESQLIYVELKSGYSDNGPAWIGLSNNSKTGATLYFNGQAFQSCKGQGIGANYFDIISGDEYWISGVKKNNEDRHWAGAGRISIDASVIEQYLELTGVSKLPKNFVKTNLLQTKQNKQHLDAEHHKLY